MASPPVCRNCGAALPRAAMACPRCGRPVFVQEGGRLRKRREAAVVGMAGSAIMAVQSASMAMGGILALVALSREFSGSRSEALAWLGLAAVFVGVTLLFDLVGVSLLATSFYLHSRGGASEPAVEAGGRRISLHALYASVFLVLWVLITLAWRGALAAIIQFYPTPFGADFDRVPVPDLRRAATVMLGLWVAAAFLLFLGARAGARYLRGRRGASTTFWRVLWPLETLIHFCAAVGITLIAPALLARLGQIELTTLRVALALGMIDLVLVPALGILAYTYMFGDFLDLYREARVAEVPPAPPESAPGEA